MADQDTLARERQINNLIDTVRRQGEEIERLKRLLLGADTTQARPFVPEPAVSGLWELVVVDAGTADGMAWLEMREL